MATTDTDTQKPVTAWDENGNPITPSQASAPAPTGYTAWDENGKPIADSFVQPPLPKESLGRRVQEDVGSMIPEFLTPALAAGKKYLVDPFEAMAKKGAEAGSQVGLATVEHPFLSSIPIVGSSLAAAKAITEPPEQSQEFEKEHPLISGAAKGVGGFVGSTIADPRNWPFLLEAPVKSAAKTVLQRLMQGGFSLQTLINAGRTIPGIAQAIHNGDYESATQMLTQASLGAGLGTATALGAVSKGSIPPPEPAEEVSAEPEPPAPKPVPALPAAPERPALPPATISGEPIRTYIPSKFETEPNAIPLPLSERAIRLPGITKALPPFRGTEEEDFVAGEPTPTPRFSKYPLQQGIFGPSERTPEGRVPDAAPRPPTDLTTLDRNALPSQLVSPEDLKFDREVHPQRTEGRVQERIDDIRAGKEPRVTGVLTPDGKISVAKGHQTGWAAQEEGAPVRATVLPMTLAEKDAAEMKSHEFPENDVPVPAKMFADTKEDRDKVDAASEKGYIEASKKSFSPIEFSRDSNGILWAKNEKVSPNPVSIPASIPEDQRESYASQKLEEQGKNAAAIKKTLHEKISAANAISPAARAIAALHEQNGGSTVNLKTGNLMGKDLYAVGAHPEAELTLDHAPSPEEVQQFIDKNAKLLARPGRSVGTWNAGDGRHVLDVVATLPEKPAMALARKNNQQAIFHLGGKGEIPVGPEQTAVNASGESSASLEAQNRLAAEKQHGIGRFVVDTRSGKERPLIGVDAVDYKVKPYEISFKRDAEDRVEVVDRGAKAKEEPKVLRGGRGASEHGAITISAEDADKIRESVKRAGLRIREAAEKGRFILVDPRDPKKAISPASFLAAAATNEPRIKEAPAPETKSTIPEKGSILDRAIAHYGVTDDINKAGYITPDGRMLDFSEGGKTRQLDHGDVASIPGVQSARNSNPRIDFAAKTGSIRLLHTSDSVTLAFDKDHPPTNDQLSRVEPLLDGKKKVFVDVTNPDSNSGISGGADAEGVQDLDGLQRVVRDALRDVATNDRSAVILGQQLHSNPIKAVKDLWTDLVAKPTIDKVNDLVNVGLGKLEAALPSVQWKRMLRSGAKFLPEEYRKLKQFTVKNPIREARASAESLGRRLSENLSQRTQQFLMSVVKGDISPEQLRIIRSTPRLQDAIEAAKEARTRLDSAGLKAVMQGLLKDKTYFENIGKYVPRLYRRYEVDYDQLMNATGERRPNRLDLNRFKGRQDIPPEIRWELGEINEAAYPVARGLIDIESDAAYVNFFNQVANNPEWTSDTPKEGFKLVDPQGREWSQLPITNKLGALSGKYLHPDIYNDINEMVKVHPEMLRFFGSMMGRYKRVRIIWSPASFVWHNLSRSFLNWYELGLLNPITYGKALLDLKNQGPMYKEALNQGAIQEFQGIDPDVFDSMIDSWNKSEGGPFRRLMEMGAHTMATLKGREQGAIWKAMREFRPIAAMTGKHSDRIVQFYNALDQWMKLSGYMHLRETQPDLDPFKAADMARRATIDYMDVPKAIDTARRYFLPFVTFPSRAIPQAITASFKAPWRVLLLYGAVAAIEHASRQSLGITSEQDKQNRRISDPHAAPGTGLDQTVFGLPRYILLPSRDENGRLQYLDLNHLVHWTGVGAPPAPGVLPFGSESFSGPLALPGQIMEREVYGNPIMSTVGDVLANRDPYTGKELYGPGKEYQTPEGALLGRAWKTVTPGMTPGNYAFENLERGVEGRPDYFGNKSPLPNDILSTFAGLNIRPEDPRLEMMFRNSEFRNALDAIRKSRYSTAENASLTNQQKQVKMKELDDEETRLIQQFQRLYQ